MDESGGGMESRVMIASEGSGSTESRESNGRRESSGSRSSGGI